MTVSLHLRPEVEASAVEQARSEGVALEDYLQRIIEREVLPLPTRRVTVEEVEAALAEIARGSENLPVLTDEAMSRRGIYADHD